jgi:hypothetical protein
MQLFCNILPEQETKIKDYGTLPSIKIAVGVFMADIIFTLF